LTFHYSKVTIFTYYHIRITTYIVTENKRIELKMKNQKYIWLFGLLVTGAILIIPLLIFIPKEAKAVDSPWENIPIKAIHTDHVDIVQGPFETGRDVTRSCLECHEEEIYEIMQTSHWLWESKPVEVPWRDGEISIGKKNQINNFCIGTQGNQKQCMTCHIGYGWEDENFDFKDPLNVDCLACHADMNLYSKGNYGYAVEGVDLLAAAQSVRNPTRDNCGACHFDGGGGNGVKHGDLDQHLYNPDSNLDFHMGSLDFICTDCHRTENHQILGRLVADNFIIPEEEQVFCTDCHNSTLHQDDRINAHTNTVACQTCHIPVYAKANATKMIWDWSTAGILDEHGEPMHENDADGNHNYLSIKGNFVYDDHVIPEYFWFNGLANHQLIEDIIDTIPVQMNTLYGSYRDKGPNKASIEASKIWPVKVHRGKQIFDTIHKTLIQPKLWDVEKGQGAYWQDFDWDVAAQKGMEYAEKEYSGAYGFIETEMYWPLNHQVSPASESLSCVDCHTRNDGRLANLNDFYLPGRDRSSMLDGMGIFIILSAMLGVIVHALCRRINRNNCVLMGDQNKERAEK